MTETHAADGTPAAGDPRADIEVTAVARDLDEIELISRGFHWINERPRNR